MKKNNEYIKYDVNSKKEFLRKRLEAKKELFSIRSENDDVIVTYLPYNLEFVYIPEGVYNKGLSVIERQQARHINEDICFEENEMEFEKEVYVSDFLVTRTPILNSFVKTYLELNYYAGEENFAAYLKREQVEFVCKKLGLRMPTEIEWEYFARAGSTDIFSFGKELPNDSELEKWLSYDFSDLTCLNSNNFGLYGIYTGEWCSDPYKKNSYSLETDGYVVKGGGAYFWPWQADEWIWCMSAMRMSSRGLIDGECGFRLVCDI